MDAKNQLYFFLCCVVVGYCGGGIYEIVSLLRLPFCFCKRLRAAAKTGTDLLFGAAFACFAIYTAFCLRFTGVRGYMFIGYLCGGLLYAKTLRRIVAFLEKVCYNRLTETVKRLKTTKNSPN